MFVARSGGSLPPVGERGLAVAFQDCACGAGVAALLALEPLAAGVRTVTELQLGDTSAEPVGRLITHGSLSLLLLRSLADVEEISVGAAVCALAAGSKLLVFAALRFPATLPDDGVVRTIAFSGASRGERPAFPPDAAVEDGFLAALLHVARASGTPTLALLAPAHKARRSDVEEVTDVCRLLAAAAARELDCAFEMKSSEAVRAPKSSERDEDRRLLYT